MHVVGVKNQIDFMVFCYLKRFGGVYRDNDPLFASETESKVDLQTQTNAIRRPVNNMINTIQAKGSRACIMQVIPNLSSSNGLL